MSRRVQRVLSRLTSTTSLHGTQEEEHDPYDTSAVHTFIKQTCNGATLVEEHQVRNTLYAPHHSYLPVFIIIIIIIILLLKSGVYNI